MKNKTTLIVSAFLSAFLITVGVGTISVVSAKNKQSAQIEATNAAAVSQKIQQPTQNIVETVVANSATPVAEAYIVTASQAADLAEQTTGMTPDALPELVSLDGTPAYEVVYESGKVYVDANSGDILYNGIPQAVAAITADQALAIAMNYLPGVQPVAMGQALYNSNPVYVVAFSDGQSVYVDQTGNVVAVQMASSTQNNQNSSERHDEDDSHDEDHDSEEYDD